MSKFYISATWDDAAHLTEEAKAELWESIPVYQRDARSKGIPELGSGAIYPILQRDITVPDFQVPKEWPRVYGLDVGWNWTAAVWAAIDRESKKVYIWRVYKRGQAEPSVHVTGIQAPGKWIPGVIDPAAQTSGQKDGTRLIEEYKSLGLNIEKATNAVESGLFAVYNRLSTGQLRIFASCAEWFAEYTNYHRDKNGDVVKENDHLMDATRYLVMSGLPRAIVEPAPQVTDDLIYEVGSSSQDSSLGWMRA